MRKLAYLVALLLALASPAWGAVTIDGGPTRRFVRFTGAPAACVTGQVYYDTSAALFYGCTATNTWTVFGAAFPLLGANGTSSAPSYSFANFPTIGMYANTNLALAEGTGSFLITGTTAAPAAPTTALSGAGAGNVDNGSHVVVQTCITAGGETLPSVISNATTVADKTVNGKITVTLVACNAFSTGRNLYASKAGTTTPLFLIVASPVIADGSTTATYTYNTADASLQAGVAPTSTTAIDARLTCVNGGTCTLAQGTLVVPAGTAAAPTITGTGALTSGVFFGSNTVGLSQNGAQAALFTSNSTRIGPPDAAAPAAQTITVPSVVAGTSNTAGANTTIQGSASTGTGAGGTIIFQASGAGNTGTSVNTLNTILTLKDGGTAGVSAPQANLPSAALLSWSTDLFLQRDAANILALRNGVNAQAFRVYNTFTDASNGEWGGLTWASNILDIGSDGNGTGQARTIRFKSGGTQVANSTTTKWTFVVTAANSDTLTAGTMTAVKTAELRSVTHSYAWTNAMVTALGAVTAGDITVATLPAKTNVDDVKVVIDTPDTSTNALTVACGTVATTYIDYVVASDAKAAANTVYGDATAERGTNMVIVGGHLPSYTGTTALNCHFIKTTTNLSTVLGSTGHVIITTRLLP